MSKKKKKIPSAILEGEVNQRRQGNYRRAKNWGDKKESRQEEKVKLKQSY